jgi:hypothetical protein
MPEGGIVLWPTGHTLINEAIILLTLAPPPWMVALAPSGTAATATAAATAAAAAPAAAERAGAQVNPLALALAGVGRGEHSPAK